ncbi:MAG: cyclase family protein, partial [Thermoplasmatota archaeon]
FSYMLIDLTQYIDEQSTVYPGTPPVQISQIARIEKQGFNEQQISISTHTSTHIDAPYHMLSKGKPLSAYPIEYFIGKAVVINVCDQQQIKADLGNVEKDDIVFFNTGHQSQCHTSDYFSNPPVISRKTAEELIKKHVRIVGIDSFTVDSHPYPVHHLFFNHDICIVEGLIHLEQILQHRFRCYILPLKLRKSDGAPCRVIAETR